MAYNPYQELLDQEAATLDTKITQAQNTYDNVTSQLDTQASTANDYLIDQSRQAYVSKLQTEQALPQYYAYNNLGYSPTETALLNINTTYENSRAAAEKTYLETLQQIDSDRNSLLLEYENDVAEFNNDYNENVTNIKNDMYESQAETASTTSSTATTSNQLYYDDGSLTATINYNDDYEKALFSAIIDSGYNVFQVVASPSIQSELATKYGLNKDTGEVFDAEDIARLREEIYGKLL